MYFWYRLEDDIGNILSNVYKKVRKYLLGEGGFLKDEKKKFINNIIIDSNIDDVHGYDSICSKS